MRLGGWRRRHAEHRRRLEEVQRANAQADEQLDTAHREYVVPMRDMRARNHVSEALDEIFDQGNQQ